MSHLFIIFSVPYQPVVGTLGKFPNWHLFQSKFHFSIGKLWATIEILISAQLSIKSIFSNIISIGYWQNFTFGPILCSNLHLVCIAKWEISTISLTVWHVGYQSHGIS